MIEIQDLNGVIPGLPDSGQAYMVFGYEGREQREQAISKNFGKKFEVDVKE